jgi:DhnA family fructose-bisphosphate aldolase class Ia
VISVGAKGVIMGRNVWGYKNPAAMVKALVKIVHENFSVEEAFKLLAE